MEDKKFVEKKIKGKCLNCGHNELIYRETIYEIPNSGKHMIVSMECPKCGFVYKDFYPIEKKESKEINIEVKDKEGLNTLISRSSDAWIKLENLNLVVKPIEGEPMLTTIEGLLNKMEKAVNIMGNEKVKKKFKEMLELKEPIKIKILDKSGLSNVVYKKGNVDVKEKKLSEEEYLKKEKAL